MLGHPTRESAYKLRWHLSAFALKKLFKNHSKSTSPTSASFLEWCQHFQNTHAECYHLRNSYYQLPLQITINHRELNSIIAVLRLILVGAPWNISRYELKLELILTCFFSSQIIKNQVECIIIKVHCIEVCYKKFMCHTIKDFW